MENCKHKNTHFESWPDGGDIEICHDCGMSRHIDIIDLDWVMVDDIEEDRKQLEEYLTERFRIGGYHGQDL